ncbi:hypothetical protein [Sphingomonas jaspsi]|uniref:hypothetical protein n=1 Tax=Sphingomonas jaspsi TaxID=392409 RepID=UPI0004B40168|nr:hypothetical protein [Sphingomonas jaspsi]
MRAALLSLLPLALLATAGDASPRQSGEERLAKMLEGRTAGAPVDCVRTLPNTDMTVIDGTAIVIKRGGTIYVNRTSDPRSLDDSDYLVLRRFGDGGQLCSIDTMTAYDRGSNIYSGNVFLSEFVPYTKAK